MADNVCLVIAPPPTFVADNVCLVIAPPTDFRGKQCMFGNSLNLLAPDLAAGLGFADLGRFILSLDELGPKLIGA